jgi:uncharacterized repeat protein (TIGR03806 family)
VKRASELRTLIVAAALAIVAVVAVVACGDGGTSDAPAAPPAEAGPAPDADGNDAARSPYGLDARPSNPSCVARPRPPGASPVKFVRVFEAVNTYGVLAMAQRPGDASRWFAAVQGGSIIAFPSSGASPAVEVADLGALTGEPVSIDGEGGLLSLAFHPKFAQNGRLYVSWTSATKSVLGFVTSSDGGQSFTQYQTILSFERGGRHCGGGLAFGNDGYLYASFGDKGGGYNGQILSSFDAKVLRLDVDTPPPPGATYAIPDGNPFKNGGGEPATFAWGFRNPFRIAIDRATNDLWVGDVGESAYEEIDLVRAGSNHGWPCREGAHDQDVTACATLLGLTDPVVEHAHTDSASRAIMGGVVYRGATMPALSGSYVYGDFVQQDLRILSFDASTGAPTSTVVNEQGPFDSWLGFPQDEAGEVYAIGGGTGIYKLVPAATPSPSAFPEKLSATGCFTGTQPASGLVPYAVNAELWSDGAEKERWLALPDGKTITISPDGHLDMPVGSVLAKTFTLGGKRVETRLFMRHEDGGWAGYSYEWNETQSDAQLLPAGKAKRVGSQTWSYPSRSDCVRCHTAAAGRTLGLELGQLNRDVTYPSTQRSGNQLRTLEHIGAFDAPLGREVTDLPAYPAPTGQGEPEARARAWLHANCAHCHRPGTPGRATLDLRFGTKLADTHACGAVSLLDDLGVPDARILAPGSPATSLLSLRPHATNDKRMPPLASHVVDGAGLAVLDGWIRALGSCP